MRYRAAGLFFLALLVGMESLATEHRLVVHEWGTFTSIAGANGASLEWCPLDGPRDLPRFVYDIGSRQSPKIDRRARIRMETPVLYFYSPKDTSVSVQVSFPQGHITEWYPRARLSGRGIDWGSIQVLPGSTPELPLEPEANHYYAARQTEAAPIHVSESGEYEKFLFYRGLGTFDLPIAVRPAGDKVVVRRVGAVHQAILFENRGGCVGYGIHDLGGYNEAALERPRLEGSLPALRRDLAKLLVNHGLYPKEAEAMIDTWRDSWFEEGIRVFYMIPQEITAKILPLTIQPQPAELVRVLVGRIEILTPEMEREIERAIVALGHSSAEVRELAIATLRRYGRYGQPVIERLLQGGSLLDSGQAIPSAREIAGYLANRPTAHKQGDRR